MHYKCQKNNEINSLEGVVKCLAYWGRGRGGGGYDAFHRYFGIYYNVTVFGEGPGRWVSKQLRKG